MTFVRISVSSFFRQQAARRAGAALVGVAMFSLLGGCAEQRIRDASRTALAAGDYEHSVQLLNDGVKEHPESELIRSSLVLTKDAAVTQLLTSARTLMAQGEFDEAGLQVERALALDPFGSRPQELKAQLAIVRRQQRALADAQALVQKRQPEAALRLIAQSLKDNPRHQALQDLQRQLAAEQRQLQIRQQAQLALTETRPISLDFRDAGLRTVLDLVSRSSGINFILDKDIRPDTRVTVYMKQARVEDALDLIVGTNQLAKKVIDPQTVVIYPNTAEKQREYQEQIVRVFYLSNAEAKNAAGFLRSMLKLREPFVDERSNMLALRDSPENIQLAERLISLYDTSEPEVLLEVEVMEISDNKTLQAGVSLPTSVGFSLTAPNGTSDSSGTGSSGLNLANIRHLTRDRIAISVGGATATLNRQMGDFTTLANPRIRVRNREKAKVMVGEKIPVVSATTGQTGFVADSVSYLDVGLKLEVEPTIYTNDEVGIKLGLEVSSLGTAVQTKAGTLAYQISTRNTSTVLRLHDGESQLLAGLISKDESHSSNGLPGLDALPLLGRLFASKTDVNNRTELVLVITPRIVRNIRLADAGETELWVGTEAQPKLRPVGGLRAATAKDVDPDAKVPSTAAGPGSLQPATNASARDGAAPPKATTLQWAQTGAAKVGDIVELGLDVDAVQAMRGMTFEIAFDHARLQLLDASEGDFFKQGGAATSFSRNDDKGSEATLRVGILRNQATAAVGRGKVFTLRFKANAAGNADVRVLTAKPIGLDATAQGPVQLPLATLRIQ